MHEKTGGNGNTPQKTKTVAIVAPTRSNSLDYLNFEEKRRLIASSLSLSDFLNVGNADAKELKDIKEGVTTVIVDDHFSLDYITRAVCSGMLLQYGIMEDNLPIDIIRAQNQPHAPEALRRISQDSNDDLPEYEVDPPENFENNTNAQNVWFPNKRPSSKDNEATRLLLKIRSRSNIKKLFSDKKTHKNRIWHDIATELIKNGFLVGEGKEGAEKCRQKFANLQKSYIQFLTNVKSTGKEFQEKPPFFDELDEILGQKDKVNPKYLSESLASSSATSDHIGKDNSTTPENSNDTTRNRYAGTKKTVRVHLAKNEVVQAIQNMHAEQMGQFNNITNIIQEGINSQNALLQIQNEIKKDMLDFFKKTWTDENNSKRNKKRKYSSDED